MPRCEIASLGWGVVTDDNGTALAGRSVVITPVAGGAVWDGYVNGAMPSNIVTRPDGTIPHYIDEGVYDVTIAGETSRVEVISGARFANEALRLYEVPAKVTPGANVAALQARDNGSGKTVLVVVWPGGAETILATQP